MTLADYLDYPIAVRSATESDWLYFSQLSLRSGRLTVVDAILFDGPTIDLPPGEYKVYAKVFVCPDDDRRISRLRTSRLAAATVGPKIAEVSVEFAILGVGDFPAVRAAGDQMIDPTTYESVVLGAANTQKLCGTIPCSANGEADMPWVTPRLGDGLYPVYEVLEGGERVGIEVVFIGPDGESVG